MTTVYYQTAATIRQFWIDAGLGLEDFHADGIIANADAESSLNWLAVGDGGKAYGLHQLHSDRTVGIYEGFKDHASGKIIWPGSWIDVAKLPSLNAQLCAVKWELLHSEHHALAMLKTATDATEAGSLFCQYYERPGAPGQAEKRGARAAWWNAYFAKNPVA